MPLDGYLRFVLALVFVLALIAGLAWLYKRYGQGRVAAPRSRPGAGFRRLGIVEAVALDSKRRLVLVRRDDREHLIIVGTQGETVVESGIVAIEGRTVGAHTASRAAGRHDRFDDRYDDEPDAADAGDATPHGRRARHASPPASFLRLVRQTTREPS